MKTCLFLILLLLDCIQLIFCVDLSNVSEEVCPVTWFRRKRANNEYTRWRSNIDTTSEFIVKVLDDDIATSSPNQIVAVNILPVTKRGEKIIVGGAMVPLPTTANPNSEAMPREYTRFVPPTSVATAGVEEQPYLVMASLPPPKIEVAPIKPEPAALVKETPFFPVNPAAKNPYRDESPPASPQFIARVPPTPSARQYAPIAPVAFTRRRTHTPLTPPPYENIPYRQPTRSSPPFVPTRTIPQEFPFFQAFIEEEGNEHQQRPLTRTSVDDSPHRTTEMKTEPIFVDDDIESIATSMKSESNYEEQRGHELQIVESESSESEERSKEVSRKEDEELYYGKDYKEDYKNEKDDSSTIYYEAKAKQLLNYVTSFVNLTDETTYTVNDPTGIRSGGQIYSDDRAESTPLEGITETEYSGLSATHLSSDEKSRDKRRPVCNMIKLRQFNFSSPRTLPEVVAQLKQWADESPIVKWVDITGGNLTTMENPIYMMIVDDTSVGQVASEKLNAFIVAGIHGRDHHAVAGVMYILYQLIERTDTHQDILSKYRFYVIPVFNPDGYDYAMTFPHRREWMKNLRQTWDACKGRESCQFCDTHGLRCTISPCYGVNLDRNFEYQWIPPDELQAEHPCGNLYAGSRQLSEPETLALSNYLERLKAHMSVFIAFKEGDVLGIMYPYSHIRKRRPYDSVYRQKAGRAAASAYSIAGRPYVAGQTSEFLPLYAGGIEDWADGHLGIDNVFTVVMFRPTDSHSKDLTEKVVHEAYAAMDSLLLSSLSVQTLRPPIITLARSKAFTYGPSITLLSLACLLTSLYS